MNLKWILEKLKLGHINEVINALENATPDDLNKLGSYCLSVGLTMQLFKLNKFCDTPMFKEDREVITNDNCN